MVTKKKSASAKSKTKLNKGFDDGYESFKLNKPKTPFFCFSFTRQTLYWSILFCIILIYGIWLTHIQADLYKIYNEIEESILLDQSSIIDQKQ